MHRITLIILVLLGLLAFTATPLRADAEADFERVRDDVFFALTDPIPAGMAARLQERRRLLRRLFRDVPPEFAPEFLGELGESNNGGEFSELFHGELATAARLELLNILRDHITSLDGQSPSVDATVEEGEIEIAYGPTQQQLITSAHTAKEMLLNSNESGIGVGRMRCVLERMESSSTTFDDVYYPVAPGPDLTEDLNPQACYKKGFWGENGYDYESRTPSDALITCRRKFADTLVKKVERGDDNITDFLLNTHSEIDRGLQHLIQLRALGGADADGTEIMMTPATRAIVNEINTLRTINSIYACY